MDKILIEIYIPVLQNSYEVYIPNKCKLFNVIPVLCKCISDLYENFYLDKDNNVLCKRDTGEIIDINKSALELNLLNGSELILM